MNILTALSSLASGTTRSESPPGEIASFEFRFRRNLWHIFLRDAEFTAQPARADVRFYGNYKIYKASHRESKHPYILSKVDIHSRPFDVYAGSNEFSLLFFQDAMRDPRSNATHKLHHSYSPFAFSKTHSLPSIHTIPLLKLARHLFFVL